MIRLALAAVVLTLAACANPEQAPCVEPNCVHAPTAPVPLG